MKVKLRRTETVRAFKKANLLRKTADSLEKEEWNWNQPGRCTLGHMFRVISNLSPTELETALQSMKFYQRGDWSSRTIFCLETGIALPDIVKSLLDIGFTPKEMIDIEWLGIDRYNSDKEPKTEEKEEVVKFLRSYATKLEKNSLAKKVRRLVKV